VRAASLLFVAVVAAAACLAGAASGSGTKPTIGRAVATPAQPQAGASFKVAFHVANGLTAAFSVTLAGRAAHHVDSFRGGVARTTIALPVSAGGKSLTVKVTAHSRTALATKQATYIVHAVAPPAISIEGASTAEGNSGTTPLSFQVTLSHASTNSVSVQYATANASAVAPSDFVAAGGTLTFAPGETSKAIAVAVVGDIVLEPDESFSVTLSNPVHATIAVGSATGLITNDDTAAPVAAGYWQGATNEGEYVFFTVGGDRSVTDFRANNISLNCGGGDEFLSPTTWGTSVFPVATDGTFGAQNDWTGSEVDGDVTLTAQSWKLSGIFDAATTMHGTIFLTAALTYQGANYVCTANLTYTATRVG